MKKRLLIVALVGFALVVLVSISVVILKSGNRKCALSNSEPSLDASSIELVSSSTNKALVSVSGYMQISASGKTRYMEIEANQISLDKLKDKDHYELGISSSCNDLKFDLGIDTTGLVTVEKIIVYQMDTTNKNQYLCSVGQSGITFPLKNSYSCTSKLSMDCVENVKADNLPDLKGHHTKKEMKLVITNLQLEIFGNSTMIEHHRFSKDPYFCI